MSMGAMSMVYPGGATAATAAAFIVLSAVQVCSSILCWLQPTSRLVIMVQEPSLCIFSVGGSFLLNTSCAHGSFLSHRGTPSYHPYFSGIFHGQKQSSERPGIVHGKPGPSGQQPDGVLVNLQWLKISKEFCTKEHKELEK